MLRMLNMLKNKKGFTLIELVIIIILLGVLAAIAIPRYVDLRDQAIRASSQATLDAGRAAVQLDFADQILTTGVYDNKISSATAAGTVFDPTDVTDLQAELQSTPNYPLSATGAYNDPAGVGFRWWMVTKGTATPAVPPVIDGGIDLSCPTAGTFWTAANDDCKVSML